MRRVIYSEPQDVFFDDVRHNRIVDKMCVSAGLVGVHPGVSELKSWESNAPRIKDLLELGRVQDVQVTFEYLIPYNLTRIDCMIYGRGLDGVGTAVHIELKQWGNRTVRPAAAEGNFDVQDEEVNVLALTGGAYRTECHPSQQVRGYDEYLRNFVEVFDLTTIRLKGMAYCYNYLRKTAEPTELFNPKFKDLLGAYRTYAKDDVDDLAMELHDLLRKGDGLAVFNKVMESPVRPSRKLLDEAAALVENGKTSAFALIRDQIVAKNAIMNRIRKMRDGVKRVILVKGGPGTGKTVIALHVLAELARCKTHNLNIRYATKSKPLVEGVKSRLPRGARSKKLFVSLSQFIPACCEQDEFDVLLVDEAHRIQKNANTQFTKAWQRTDMPMVDTIVRAAKVCVFFIDDRQAIRSVEIGSTELIRQSAARFGAEVEEVELKSQFRCNGSDNYLDWVEQILYNRPVTAKFTEVDFDFRVVDSPSQLYAMIQGKDRPEKGRTARIMAGFCWPWSDRLDSRGELVKDVRIGDFAMPWETKGTIDHPPAGYVKWYEWAYRPEGIRQIGCIYTAQGFEFDYAGVIIGPDLAYDSESKRLVTNAKATEDPMLRRGREKFDDYVRNIYRVLMSRGMKGCYVYCCDKHLAEFLKGQLSMMRGDKVENHDVEIVATVELALQYVEYLPLYSMRAACGYFGEGEDVDIAGWVKAEGVGRLNRNLFVVRASGNSMEPRIHDGDLCVFRSNPAGSRDGKIVLAQHRDTFDNDTAGAYSIKRYSSRKNYGEEGSWQHEEIVLSPLNPAYSEIRLDDVDDGAFRIVGEFVGIVC